MVPERFVTHKELNEYNDRLRKEIRTDISKSDKVVEKLDTRVQKIDEKVDMLNDLVLPLTIAMNQTADNTKEMSQSLKEFTKAQTTTNDILNEKINGHAITIENLKGVTSSMTEKKKYNVTVVVALIGLVGVFVTGLFQLAPFLFQ